MCDLNDFLERFLGLGFFNRKSRFLFCFGNVQTIAIIAVGEGGLLQLGSTQKVGACFLAFSLSSFCCCCCCCCCEGIGSGEEANLTVCGVWKTFLLFLCVCIQIKMAMAMAGGGRCGVCGEGAEEVPLPHAAEHLSRSRSRSSGRSVLIWLFSAAAAALSTAWPP